MQLSQLLLGLLDIRLLAQISLAIYLYDPLAVIF